MLNIDSTEAHYSNVQKIQNDISELRNKSEFEGLDQSDYFRIAAIPKENVVEVLKSVDDSNRLDKAIDIGLLSRIAEKEWSYVNNRPIIFVRIAGEIIPFYRSSKGTGGKVAGEWYPMFGFGTNVDGSPYWIIKGDDENCKTGYNNPVIKKIQDILNSSFNWNPDLDIKKRELLDNHPLNNKNKDNFLSPAQLNEAIFGRSDLDVKAEDRSATDHIMKIFTRLIDTGNKYIQYVIRISKENN